MEPKSPEVRQRRPLRKAREDSQARFEALKAEKAISKTKVRGLENVAPKKPTKVDKKEEAADDVTAKAEKKNSKASAAAKSGGASSSASSSKEADKKKTTGAKSKGESKTDDDIVEEKPAPPAQKRRSKSLGSAHSTDAAKKKPTKNAAIAELSSLPAKKGRGKKVDEVESQIKPKAGKRAAPPVVVGNSEVAQDAPKGRAANKTADKSPDRVPSKRARGKAASKPTEVESPESDEVDAPAKKSRSASKVASKTVAKQSSVSDDEAVPVKKGNKQKHVPVKKFQDTAMPVGQSECSGSDEETPLPSKKASNKHKNLKSMFDSEDEEEQMEAPEASEKKTPHKSTDYDSTASEGDSKEPNDQPGNSRKTKATKPPPVPAKKGRGKAQKPDSSDDGDADQPSSSKAGKKLQNKVDTDYSDMDFDIKEKFNMKIVTWNVAGLKALAKKNVDYFQKENADIICLNELKCTDEDDVPDVFKLDGYSCHWNVAKGHPGNAVLSKVEPLEVTFDLENTDFSDAHRLITVEYEKFFLVSTYVVNSGRGLKTLESRLKWNKVFDAHILKLDKKKPVIITGDFNVSHQEIDLANPKANKKNAGFTQEERDGFTELLSHGFVDTFRHFHPDQVGAYTFWTYLANARAKNVGWRLDYFLVSTRYMKHVKDNVIRSKVLGSDHCPIALFLNV